MKSIERKGKKTWHPKLQTTEQPLSGTCVSSLLTDSCLALSRQKFFSPSKNLKHLFQNPGVNYE